MSLLQARHNEVCGRDIAPEYYEAMYEVVNKLCRVAANPSYIDSWRDIEGYSRLTVKMIEETTDAD
jgi:hypothetical protein